jgi:thiamine biosynthesis lipoprotein
MPKTEIFNDSFMAMGTRCDVVFTDVENDFAQLMFQRVKTVFIHLEKILSRFIPDSPVAELNRAGKNKWMPVPEELWNVLTLCFDFYQMSNGAFDVTAGPIISLWKSSSANPGKISKKEIKEALKKSGFHKVDMDFVKKKIRFKEDEMEFDFGAIGKGIALDTVQPILLENGIKNGIISVGESSILALGNHPNGEKWPLRIKSTFQPEQYVHIFSVSNECVTSSGGVVNDENGKVKWRNHIISPVYGRPVEGNRMVSVKSLFASLGEFLSTTWLILPDEDKNILAEQLEGIEILEVEYQDEKDFKTKLTML